LGDLGLLIGDLQIVPVDQAAMRFFVYHFGNTVLYEERFSFGDTVLFLDIPFFF
jgi:hypothetical protein